MKKIAVPIFPTLITTYENFLSEKECSLIFDFCKEKETSNHPALNGEASSSYDVNSDLIEELETKIPVLNGISSRLQKVLDEYSNDFGMNRNFLSNSWFNIQQPGSLLRQHIHGHSVVSSAIFINVDENSSDLYFENPNPYCQFSNFIEDHESGYTFSKYRFKVKKGTLILFPSWLKHGSMYEINKTKDRMVLSFNAKHEKNYS